MQGLFTTLSPGLSATDGAAQASNGLGSSANGVSSGSQGSSPLFSNLLTSAAQSDQVQFKSQLLSAFAGQALPPEGQLLPPGDSSGLVNQDVSGLLNANELKNSLAKRTAEGDDALTIDIDVNMQPVVSPSVVANDAMRAQNLPAQLAGAGAAASQLAGQGHSKLQQDLLMRQLAMAPIEEAEGGLSSVRLTSQLENAPLLGSSVQLSNMLRDAMLLKQPPTTGSGSESKIGDSFGSAMGNLSALSTDAKSGSDTKPLMQASINTPFSQQAGWGEEVGSRVKWMVNSQVQSAELKMNPAHLGPVEVKISVQNDQTTIHFTAQNGAVREALDSAMPRLREMLGDNGVNLADVDVSDQSFAQQQQASEEEREAMDGHGNLGDGRDDGLEPEGSTEMEEGEMMLSSRMVDYYA